MSSRRERPDRDAGSAVRHVGRGAPDRDLLLGGGCRAHRAVRPRIRVQLPGQLGEHRVGARPHPRRLPGARRRSARPRRERQAARSARLHDGGARRRPARRCSTPTCSTRVRYAGYSLGGRVGWQLLVDAPDRVTRGVLGGIPDGRPLARLKIDAGPRLRRERHPRSTDRVTQNYVTLAERVPGNDLRRARRARRGHAARRCRSRPGATAAAAGAVRDRQRGRDPRALAAPGLGHARAASSSRSPAGTTSTRPDRGCSARPRSSSSRATDRSRFPPDCSPCAPPLDPGAEMRSPLSWRSERLARTPGASDPPPHAASPGGPDEWKCYARNRQAHHRPRPRSVGGRLELERGHHAAAAAGLHRARAAERAARADVGRRLHRVVPRAAHQRTGRARRPLLRRRGHHQRRRPGRRRQGARVRRRVHPRRGRDGGRHPRRLEFGTRRSPTRRPCSTSRATRVRRRARPRRSSSPRPCTRPSRRICPRPIAADRRRPATCVVRRQCHPVGAAGVEVDPELGGARHRRISSSRSTCSDGWQSAPVRRSPKSTPRTCR